MIILHTPKNVEYTVKGFREKNMDNFPNILEECLDKSNNIYI